MSRKKTRRKRSDDEYKKLAKELKRYTATDYTKKRKLRPQDKAALTRAANLVSTATFIPIKRKPKETTKQYQARITDYQRSHGLPVNRNIAGVVAVLPDGAKKAKATKDAITYELPAIKTKHGGRAKKTYRTKTGYRIRVRTDEDGESKPLTERVRSGIEAQLRGAMRGMKRPVELFARVGSRVNSRREIYTDDDLQILLGEVIERLEHYAISGTLIVTARGM